MARIAHRLTVSVVMAIALVSGITHGQPQWRPSGTFDGSLARRASVYALAVDPANSDRVYVAVDNALFLSVDGGRTFATLPPVPSFRPIRSLGVANMPGASLPTLVVGLQSDGVLTSNDGGRTYVRGDLPPLSGGMLQTTWVVYTVPGRADVVYLQADSLYRSDDGGLHWLRVPPPDASGSSFFTLAIAEGGGTVLLGLEGGLLASSDRGASWKPIAGGLPAPPYPSAALPAFDNTRQGAVFVIVPEAGTFRSMDGGTSWTRTGPSPFQCCMYTMIAHGDNLWVLTNGARVYMSRDGGASWQQSPLPPFMSPEAIARDASTGRLYVGVRQEGGGSLWRSSDGGSTWIADSRGLSGARIDALVADPDRMLFADAYFGQHASGGRDDWRDVSARPTGPSQYTPHPIIRTGPGRLMTSGPPFARSDDGGASWIEIPRTWPTPNNFRMLAAEPGAPHILYAREDKLAASGHSFYLAAASPRQSSDGGATWIAIDQGLPAFTYRVLAMGGGRLLADTSDGLWRSSDTGFTWSRVTAITGRVLDLRARPGRESTVMVTTPDGIWRSDDGAVTFIYLGGLPANNAQFIAFDWHTNDDVYLLVENGDVFAGSDGGKAWQRFGGAGSPGFGLLLDVTVSPWSAGTLYAATTTGVHKLVARGGVVVANEYYHPEFGHYFLTASREESVALAIGTLAQWRPTGRRIDVWQDGAASLAPVCRFFSASFAPKSSHFYTPFISECAELRRGSVWVDEGIAFHLRLPEGALGAASCPEDTQPLYRAYNAFMGGAPNHRYTIDSSVLDAMLGQGWIMEGEAATRVFACAPPQR